MRRRRALEAQRQELELIDQEQIVAAEARAAAAEARRAALEEQCNKLLSGQMSAEEQLALAEGKAKEQQVDALAKNAMRRLKQQGLVRGWTQWHVMWAEAARHQRMLAGAGARLNKPAVIACLANWRSDWEAVEKQKLAHQGQNLTRQLAAEQKRSGALEASLQELRNEHAANLKDHRQGAQKLKLLEQKVARMLNGQLNVEQQLAFAEEQAKEQRV